MQKHPFFWGGGGTYWLKQRLGGVEINFRNVDKARAIKLHTLIFDIFIFLGGGQHSRNRGSGRF